MFKILSLAVLLLMPGVLHAEEASEPKTNPVIERAKELSEGLDKQSRRHFNVMYGNYNMVHVVKTVRESVDEAVTECGKSNEDLKQPLETRFAEWKNAVNPLLKEASANVDNMVLVQDYASKKDIRNFFKLIDKVRKDTRKEVKRVPVTTKEACEYLLENMDKTQPRMMELLEATLVTLPRAMQLEDEQERRKMEEEMQQELEEHEASDT